jgi:FixJ family two-component response regulator
MARLDARVIGIVDDDPSLRRSLRNLPMSVGFRVETLESTTAFLQSTWRRRDRVRGARRAHGRDERRRRAEAPGRQRRTDPVIMPTTHGDDETRRQSLEAVAVAFLEKPVRSPVLLETIRPALGATS